MTTSDNLRLRVEMRVALHMGVKLEGVQKSLELREIVDAVLDEMVPRTLVQH
jgi:hypothetical protein